MINEVNFENGPSYNEHFIVLHFYKSQWPLIVGPRDWVPKAFRYYIRYDKNRNIQENITSCGLINHP